MPNTTIIATNRITIHNILFALVLTGMATVFANTPIFAQQTETTQPSPKYSCTTDKPNTKLVAAIQPTHGNHITGTVHFTKTDTGIHVIASITGLEPNSTHGFHVHQFGDASATDGTSAGGHFNPHGHDHALPEQHQRHAGDLGNLVADENGHAQYDATLNNFTLTAKPTDILGRAVIIHAKNDNGGQPTGNAGSRIGIGIIGYAKN